MQKQNIYAHAFIHTAVKLLTVNLIFIVATLHYDKNSKKMSEIQENLLKKSLQLFGDYIIIL